MIYLNQFFFKILKQFEKIYLNSSFYDKKISKVDENTLKYKPSPHLFFSIIRYKQKKIKIEDYAIDKIWENKNINLREFKKLNNFYWFFSLDLKSSKKITQSVVKNWIKFNNKFNDKSWDFELTAKRIISWLSCHNLTLEESDKNYNHEFNRIIKKQTNHLVNEIKKTKLFNDKLIGCAAIILVALCYQNKKNYLEFALNTLKKISKSSLDETGFPKSRNIKQLIFQLKYFILIREWFKESQLSIPEHLDETIYYLGQGYAFVWQKNTSDILFNGNNISNNLEFDNYLKRLGYKFKNENYDFGGYIILNNKKICLSVDAGISPVQKFSNHYQSGALSFEIVSNGKKLISNCGYYNQGNDELCKLSRSTATQSTLVIDDQSSCSFNKINNEWFVNKGLKIIDKHVVYDKNYWKIKVSHDGYLKKYNSIHEREIEFYPDQMAFKGIDKVIQKGTNYNLKFEIRFHMEPGVKLMKTQDNKNILIELINEGWKFTCDNFDINIDNGLYFGKKNSYTENQNIFISGISNKQNENILWQLTKIK